MALPSPGELELRARAGSAVSVIVEGEATGDDAWTYGDIWFGDRAGEIRFFPQDGWAQVRDAVEVLRTRLPGIPVFGLVDRDFTPDARLDDLVSRGVFRSRVYAVENHLLEARCWHAVFELVTRRTGLPPTWADVGALQARIQESHERCFPATAFNRVVAQTARAHPSYPDAPRYARTPEDGRLSRPHAVLRDWAAACGHPEDLGLLIDRALERLRSSELDLLATLVDGKTVVRVLLAQFQEAVRIRAHEHGDYVNLYLDRCPSPPEEATSLVERILRTAGR